MSVTSKPYDIHMSAICKPYDRHMISTIVTHLNNIMPLSAVSQPHITHETSRGYADTLCRVFFGIVLFFYGPALQEWPGATCCD